MQLLQSIEQPARVLTQADIEALIEPRSAPCVSIYAPMAMAGRDTRENPIRFKNLVASARTALGDLGADEDMLEPLAGLGDDHQFWQHQQRGLAVFVADDFIRVVRAPIDVPEWRVVGSHFHLRPLLDAVATDDRFYVLALERNTVRLFVGTRFALTEVDVKFLEDEAQEIYDREYPINLHYHSTGPMSGKAGARWHGAGELPEEDRREHAKRFFQRVDTALKPALLRDRAPLLLIGDDRAVAMYREGNTYQDLLPEFVPLDPHAMPPHRIHELVLPLVRERLGTQAKADAQRLQEALPKAMALDDLLRVLDAARTAAVETLFVVQGRHRLGTMDEGSGKVSTGAATQRLTNEHPEAGADDLLDTAVILTLRTGGRVHTLHERDARIMGVPDPVAAILRR